MFCIVDYGVGNLGSISNMVKKIGAKASLAPTVSEIEKATRILLPGVGAFDNGMRCLKERGLIDVLNYKVLEEKVPVLGICLGMQLMTQSSEEGELKGLGWVNGQARRFPGTKVTVEGGRSKLRVPHMGWNTLKLQKKSPLFSSELEEYRYYFVHSYYISLDNQDEVLAKTQYGSDFVSAFQSGNVYGVQFHPEKSHKFGMALFKDFLAS